MERKPVMHIDINAIRAINGSAGQTQYANEVIDSMEEKYGEKYTLIFKIVFNN